METPDLEPDCSQCAGLCCLALAFDAGDMFAIDKPAGLPCPNLQDDFRCGIYEGLSDAGFSGCIRYDCLGAGQRVTQEVFEGKNWREQPDLTAAMMNAFHTMRKIHQNIELLAAAEVLELPDSLEEKRLGLVAQLSPASDFTPEDLDQLAESGVFAQVTAFLGDLRDHV